MRTLMVLLANITGLYSLLIIIRVMLTWFNRGGYGKPVMYLTRVTDPYLSWWRRFPILRLGFLDLSPIAAMAALSVIQTVFSMLASHGRISLGAILAIAISALWSAASFILGFCIVILIIRFIGYMTNRDITGSFWQIIDTISRPLLYRIQSLILKNRESTLMTNLVVSIISLSVIWFVGRLVVRFIIGFLFRLPV